MATAKGYDPKSTQVVDIQAPGTSQPVFDDFTEFVIRKKTERWQENANREKLLRGGVGGDAGSYRVALSHLRLKRPRRATWKPAYMPK
ncbi:hypothetical protein V5799_015877, partial [Amblyomma americanum]